MKPSWFTQLNNTGIQPGTLIWDRGNVSKDYVEIVEMTGWKLICGIPKTSKDVKNTIENTELPSDFQYLKMQGKVYETKSGEIRYVF